MVYDLELIFTSFWPKLVNFAHSGFWAIFNMYFSAPKMTRKCPLTGQNDIKTDKIALVDTKNIFCLHPSSMILHQGAL